MKPKSERHPVNVVSPERDRNCRSQYTSGDNARNRTFARETSTPFPQLPRERASRRRKKSPVLNRANTTAGGILYGAIHPLGGLVVSDNLGFSVFVNSVVIARRNAFRAFRSSAMSAGPITRRTLW